MNNKNTLCESLKVTFLRWKISNDISADRIWTSIWTKTNSSKDVGYTTKSIHSSRLTRRAGKLLRPFFSPFVRLMFIVPQKVHRFDFIIDNLQLLSTIRQSTEFIYRKALRTLVKHWKCCKRKRQTRKIWSDDHHCRKNVHSKNQNREWCQFTSFLSNWSKINGENCAIRYFPERRLSQAVS